MRKYENVQISKLKPYKNNARIHSPVQIQKIADSIAEFGFINPVLIDDDFNIIAGHGRVLGAKTLGLSEVPCLFVEDLTEAQKRAYIIADNKLTEDGGWDNNILRQELQELQDLNFDISLTGFDLGEIGLLDLGETADENEIEEDEIPEVDEEIEPTTKPGDVWQLGKHRLMCGDSTNKTDVEKLMDGKTADMVFTDPPYGYKYVSNRQNIKKYDMLQNDDKILDYISAIYKSLNDNCAVYSFCGFQTIKSWIEYFESTNLKLKNLICWVKNSWSMGDLKGAYAGQYEFILYLVKGKKELIGRRDTDVWKFDREPPKLHPTMKPLELISYALSKSSEKNNLIIDLFGGSGSTLIACEQTGRICYTMEIDPKYCDVIIQRWENLTGEKAVLLNG